MSGVRPKLTRRRGACEECRQKKVRCDGANPCNHCQRNESLCEYNIRRSRQHQRTKSIQSLDKDVSTSAQPHATNGSTMPDSSDPDHSPGVVVGQDTQGSANPLNTPFSESYFSQLVSDSAHSYVDLDFPDEMMASTDQVQIIEPCQQMSSSQNEMPYYVSRNDTPMMDWLKLGCDQIPHQHSTAQLCDLLGTEADSSGGGCTLALFSERIVADKAETRPFSTYKTYRITALFQNADRGSRIQQAVLDKVKVLLSSEHQTSLPNLLSKAEPVREHLGLDLNNLPVKELIQRTFKDPGGPSLFIKEQDVTNIQERCFETKDLPIDVSNMSLLIVSLAWGALLDPEVNLVSRVALLDAVQETTSLLLRQESSVRQFLALVALLCLAEKTGSDNVHALILGSISTAASLNLHLEPVLHKFCVSDEQAVQTKRAIWLLYCIDKSHALRWQTFSIVSDGSLPTKNPPDNVLQSDSAPSSEWLQIRSQYAKICSKILQLRVGREKEPSEDLSHNAVTLSTALEKWYKASGISQMTPSLDYSDFMRAKLQISYYYHEAQFQLLSISLLYPQPSSPIGSQESRDRELLKRSIREILTVSNTVPSDYLLQDCNHLFINTLALCMLALNILQDPSQNCGKENRALLSIIAGFFARVEIMLPESSIFEEVSNLIEILTYR
ncbi:hypothetical protein HBH70_238930 [Parastagonospora nodorum]|nr:hypothetical protein HBH53_033920 [Parastagonospora nodorum]KAH3969394.1 hypothetical protein HBH51_126070 [Parastagonospora nodorum]KAH4006394.1 hypothetical protein HBI10_021350 [Parastagonospora nodorum]KAH4025575.1 hypothetical protein HBI09_155200 [Parastagonospora nodorum]KAH4059781.1 hypothetical protein HBH49_022990 [Parastagonospora nodorum]